MLTRLHTAGNQAALTELGTANFEIVARKLTGSLKALVNMVDVETDILTQVLGTHVDHIDTLLTNKESLLDWEHRLHRVCEAQDRGRRKQPTVYANISLPLYIS
jgi:hypothetical protein